MAAGRHTFRAVLEGGHILAAHLGRGPDEVGVAIWDGAKQFTFWVTYDGYAWEHLATLQYDPEWFAAQEWAAHQLARLLLEWDR